MLGNSEEGSALVVCAGRQGNALLQSRAVTDLNPVVCMDELQQQVRHHAVCLMALVLAVDTFLVIAI